MVMRIRTLKRHVLEGLKSSWRNSWMTLASVGAVTTTLLLVSVFLALMMNLNHVAANIEEDVQIKVLIDVTATDEEISELGQSIESLNRVASVEFSSRDQELEDLISSMGDEGMHFHY